MNTPGNKAAKKARRGKRMTKFENGLRYRSASDV